MPLLHNLSGTSRALYRVFVAPPLIARVVPLNSSTKVVPHDPFLPRIVVRTKVYNAKRQALSDYFVFDRQIKAPYVNYIDAEGDFHPNTPLDFITWNRQESHLLLVDEGKTDEFGRHYPDSLPVCKIVSKIELRAQHEKKLELERRQAKGVGAGPAVKNLELNWAIGSGDLKHRLLKLKEFLIEGRKVEVILESKSKKKARKATIEECTALLQTLRDEVANIKGSSELKTPEDVVGVLGGNMTLVFQGPKLGKVEKPGKEETDELADPAQETKSQTAREAKQERRVRKQAEKEKARASAIETQTML